MGKNEIVMAHNAGCKGILVLTGGGKESLGIFRDTWRGYEADIIADNAFEAVKRIPLMRMNELVFAGEIVMKRPDMIIFDYGHTLIYQPNYNTSNGNKAIYNYISKNPRNITFEEYDKTIIDIFAKIRAERGATLEIHEYAFLKLALEYMDIELSVSFEEAEKIIMDGISMGGVMPYTDKMLDYLNSKDIRTGVISNLCFSGKALRYQLDRLLPNNKFEFTLASSDYIFRKPHSIMFEIALQKARLSADKVWYCGDSIEADIYGAKCVNIFPILYSGETIDETNPFANQNDGLRIDFDYLYIHDWRELIDILEKANS